MPGLNNSVNDAGGAGNSAKPGIQPARAGYQYGRHRAILGLGPNTGGGVTTGSARATGNSVTGPNTTVDAAIGS